MGNSLSCYENNDENVTESVDVSVSAYKEAAKAERAKQQRQADSMAFGEKLTPGPSHELLKSDSTPSQAPGNILNSPMNSSADSEVQQHAARENFKTYLKEEEEKRREKEQAKLRDQTDKVAGELNAQLSAGIGENKLLEELQQKMMNQATLVAGALEKAQQGMTDEERDALPGDQVDEVCKTVADSLFIPVNILLELPDPVKRDYVKAALENKMKTDYHKVVRRTRKERTEMIEQFKTEHPEGCSKVISKLAEWFIEFEEIDRQKIDACTDDFSDPLSGSTSYMHFLLREWLEAKKKLVE